MAGRASIVGAAATHVGKVRDHNEDAHYFDADAGVFLVCDGMGGHAAGEVASAMAIRTIRAQWSQYDTQKLVDAWIDKGTPDAKKQMLGVLRAGVVAAHAAILAEAERDESKSGMGTTLVGAMIVGNELVFAHAGDSRAYLVRDQIAVQLTEDHTLLARLLAAGIDVDVSGEGSRFRSMLTNALGIGDDVKVSTFVVPLADGDRFLLCSDGITEYVKEAEVGEVLSKQPSPARAAQKLIELALDRGGGDNATAIVVRVLEAGDSPQPAEQIKRDQDVIASCPLWGTKLTHQQRLRALRVAIPREQAIGERIPAQTLGDRVAWILVEGKAVLDGNMLEPGALIYPESLVADSQAPDRERIAVARTDVRLLAMRADDFRELCEDDTELGEALLEGLQPLIARRPRLVVRPASERVDTEIDTLDEDPGARQRKDDDRPAEEDVGVKTQPLLKRALAKIDAVPVPIDEPPPPLRAEEPDEPTDPGPPEEPVASDEPDEPEIEIVRTATPEPPPAPAPPPRTQPRPPTRPPVVREISMRPSAPGSIEEAVTARVESELDARFDAVFADAPRPGSASAPAGPAAEATRVPLILKPRASTDPSAVRIPSPALPKRVTTEPGVPPGPPVRDSSPRLPRPPTDPEIETLIELEAEPASPEESAAGMQSTVLDDDDEPEVTVTILSADADLIEGDDADAVPVTEIVTETSSQTLTISVEGDDGDDDDDEIDDATQLDDGEAILEISESADESGPIVRPLSSQRVSVSGSISTDKPPRSKRLSEGWED